MWFENKNITKLAFTEIVDSYLREIKDSTLQKIILAIAENDFTIPFLLYKNKEKQELIKCPSCGCVHSYSYEKYYICTKCGKESYKFVDFRRSRTAREAYFGMIKVNEKLLGLDILKFNYNGLVVRSFSYRFVYFCDGEIKIFFKEFERQYTCDIFKTCQFGNSYINFSFSSFTPINKVYKYSYGINFRRIDIDTFQFEEILYNQVDSLEFITDIFFERKEVERKNYFAKINSCPFLETLSKQTKKVNSFNKFLLNNDFELICYKNKYKYLKFVFDNSIGLKYFDLIVAFGDLKLVKKLNLFNLYYISIIFEFLVSFNFTPYKILEYLLTIDDYNMYFDCLKIEKQLFNSRIIKKIIFFPKNMKIAHDIFSKKLTDNKKAIEAFSFSKIEEVSKYYSFEKKVLGYDLYVPHNYSEIKEQALLLGQCLISSNYLKRVFDGECLLLFCNKKDSVKEDFYTIELLPSGKINQFRTFRNNDVSNKKLENAVKKALSNFYKKLEIVNDKFHEFI